MPYTRKTRDEYQIHGFYAHGWEELHAEETHAEAWQRIKEYRANEPMTRFKLVKRRVRIAH